jgi:NNP family nitrate/nitrite transporter-like MFS transporter
MLGRNAWYFQLLAQDVPAETAKQTARQHGQELFPAGNMVDSLVLSAKVWKTWVLVILYFTTFGGFIALTAWLPTYWNSFFAVSAVTAGMLTALYSILTSVIRIAGGAISDRIGGENTAILSLLTMLVGGILMTASHNYGLSVIGEILMALGMGTNNAAVFKLVPQEVPEAVGGAAGWVGGLGAFGGFAIPPIMGAFVRAQGDLGYAQGFATFIVLAVLSLVLANVLKRTHVRVPVTAARSEGV